MSYQNLSNYSGSLYGEPKYEGIEFDREVPNTHVVASPGGVSGIHHHWSKGFYGKGDSSSDLFAGQGNYHIHGINSNLYGTGPSAPESLGHYSAPINNEPPSRGGPASHNMSRENQSIYFDDSQKKSFEGLDGSSYEILDTETPLITENYSDTSTNTMDRNAMLIIFLLFIIASLWSTSIQSYIRQQILSLDGRMHWKTNVLVAIGATMIFFVLCYMIR